MDQQIAIQELAKNLKRLATIIRMYPPPDTEDGVLNEALRQIQEEVHDIEMQVLDA